MSYQETTGTLSPGAHAGSYNGQDAYNDMLVTEDVLRIPGNRSVQGVGESVGSENAGLQGRDGSDRRGGADVSEPILLESNQNHATIQTDGISTALPAAMGEGGGYVPMVTEPVMMSDRKGHNGVTEDGSATTLTAQEKDRPIVAAVDCRNGTENPETNGTLQAKENGGTSVNLQNTVRTRQVVRRLTPLECERLQGYTDGWTDIGEWTDEKGKKHKEADSPRYKALGNSIALPFWEWLDKRISAQYVGTCTLGSLFDGIGGFCLVHCRHNGQRSVRWASEIEDFPIAVTKQHFGDEDAGVDGDIGKYLAER